jgi:hypothetical protein
MAEILMWNTFTAKNELFWHEMEITKENLAGMTDDELVRFFASGGFLVKDLISHKGFKKPSDECRAIVDCELRRRPEVVLAISISHPNRRWS